MATMNVSLPDEMKAWIEEQVAAGRYGTTSDLVRELIRNEQDRRAKIANMQALVDEARASGFSERTFDEIIAAARVEAGVAPVKNAA